MKVLCLDPGPKTTGFALLDAQKPGGALQRAIVVSYLAHGTLPSTPADLLDTLDQFTDAFALSDHAARLELLVAVEAVEGFAYQATGNRGGGQAVVAALLATSRVVGELVASARAAEWTTVTMTARSARKRVLDKGNAQDPAIKAAIPRLIRGWPKVSNAHTRDAALLGLAAIWTMQGRSVADVAAHGLETN